jgi:hypothetical protein
MLCVIYPSEGIYVKNHLLFLFILLLLAVGFGCSDKPNKPDNKPEPYYKLIYSYVMPEFSVLTFNSITGKVMDSVWYPKVPFSDVVFSKDAARAYYSGSGATWIADVATGDTVAVDRQRAGKLVLSPDEQYLAVISATKIWLFRLPTLTLIYEKSATSIWAAFHPAKKLLYYVHGVSPAPEYDTLFRLDFGLQPPLETSTVLYDTSGQRISAGPMALSSDGQWMITTLYWNLCLLDTDSLKVRRMFRDPEHWGYYWPAAVHPDGMRVFLGYVDAPLLDPVDAGIDIFDFQSLTLTRLIHHATVPGISMFVAPIQMQPTPDGNELIGVSHNGLWSMEGFFRIDLATKTISLFGQERAGYPSVFRIDPRPYYE